METQDLPNEVIKIVVPQMFSENTGKQLNEIRKTTQEQNEKFNKEQTSPWDRVSPAGGSS